MRVSVYPRPRRTLPVALNLPSAPTWTSTCTPVSPLDKGVMLYMNSLSKDDLQTFKTLLKDEFLSHVCHVTKDQLKKATWAEVVHILVEYNPGRLAWDVTNAIFNQMNKRAMCSLVQRELEALLPSLEAENVNLGDASISLEKESDKILKYKQRVIEENEPVWNNTVWPANQSDFLYRDIQRYTELLPCLFLPQSPQGRQPKTVVIHGMPGAGKTTLARKVMVKWAQDEFYPHKFKYAFYFHCKELNWEGERSFRELIEHQKLRSRALVTTILSKPDQLLLLFDGFEELLNPLSRRTEGLSESWNERLPGSILLSSLLCKTMLPEATLLVIVRPTYWKSITPLMRFPCHVTLLGFSRSEIIEYFRAYFSNTALADQAVDFAVTNTILMVLCQAPVVCWLTCRCLSKLLRKATSLRDRCPNATSVMVLFLATLFPAIFTDFPNQSHQGQLEGLCRVAAQGMWNVNPVFEKSDFQKVLVEEESIDTFLQVNILRRLEGQEERYMFTLFVFQEFFGALFYVLCFPRRLKQYHTLSRVEIKCLVALPSVGKTCLAQMAFFLFGLLNPKCTHVVEKSFRCKVTLENRTKILRIITQLNQHDPPEVCCGVPQLMYCLLEIGEEEFASHALTGYRIASLKIQAHEDFQASAFCLKHCRDLHHVEMSLLGNLSNELWPISSRSPTSIEIKEKDMHLNWWKDICSVFRTNNGLEVLMTVNFLIGDPFLKVFIDALKQPQCRLQELYLKHVNFLLHEDFACILTRNHSLKHLQIEYTNLELEAMTSLCTALTSPLCLLESLSLEKCFAQSTDWNGLARDLQTNTNLKILMLRNNCLGEFGKYYLSVSHLTKLSLENCSFTEECYEGIAFCLSHSKMLTHLSLAENAMKDEGAKCIWKSLEYLMCPLKRLVLRQCSLTSACSQYMISALKKNKTLISLDLSLNSLRNDGIILLCEALTESDSNLMVLELEQCMFTSVSCQALSSMIRGHQKLRYLDVSSNGMEFRDILTFLGQRTANEIVLEKKSTEEVDSYTRLLGPQLQEGLLKIVQSWTS